MCCEQWNWFWSNYSKKSKMWESLWEVLNHSTVCLFSVLLFSIFPVPGRADGLKDVAIRGKEKKKKKCYSTAPVFTQMQVLSKYTYITQGIHQAFIRKVLTLLAGEG